MTSSTIEEKSAPERRGPKIPDNPTPAIALPALRTVSWNVLDAGAPPQAIGLTRQVIAEMDPRTGIVIALLQISVLNDRFLRITNTDTALTDSEGLFYLYKQTRDDGVFVSRLKVKEILKTYKRNPRVTESSDRIYALVDGSVQLAPAESEQVPLALDSGPVYLERQSGDAPTQQTATARSPVPEAGALVSSLRAGTRALPIDITTHVTSAPVYSKTLTIWATLGGVPRPFFIKQTRSHFSDVAIDIFRKSSDRLYIFKKFEKSVGYESATLHLHPEGSDSHD